MIAPILADGPEDQAEDLAVGSVGLSSSDRVLRARKAAHQSWAYTEDRSARTAPARRAALARFEHQVDPEGRLSPVERELRAESARKAYFTGLALKSAQARRRGPR